MKCPKTGNCQNFCYIFAFALYQGCDSRKKISDFTIENTFNFKIIPGIFPILRLFSPGERVMIFATIGSPQRKFPIAASLEKIQSVVMEEHGFDHRDKQSLTAFF